MTPHRKDLRARFDRLLAIMESEQFLGVYGLGKEVPFFIVAVRPDDAGSIAEVVSMLATRLERQGIATLTIDLYDLALDILRERGLLDRLVQMEAELDRHDMLQLLQDVLDPRDRLVPEIERRMAQAHFHILLVTGVGEVYPYIRSHSVLHCLQRAAKAHPMVFFYPGEYEHAADGSSRLRLFGRLADDRYYRAFDIDGYHLMPQKPS